MTTDDLALLDAAEAIERLTLAACEARDSIERALWVFGDDLALESALSALRAALATPPPATVDEPKPPCPACGSTPRWPSRDELSKALGGVVFYPVVGMNSLMTYEETADAILAALREGGERP